MIKTYSAVKNTSKSNIQDNQKLTISIHYVFPPSKRNYLKLKCSAIDKQRSIFKEALCISFLFFFKLTPFLPLFLPLTLSLSLSVALVEFSEGTYR